MEKSAKKIQEKQSTQARVVKTALSPLKGFWQFLSQKAVVGMAVGLIVGSSVKDIVQILVDGLIQPFIRLFMPDTAKVEGWIWRVNGVEFKIGQVLSVFLQTFIIFLILYIVVGKLLRQEHLLDQAGLTKKKKKN